MKRTKIAAIAAAMALIMSASACGNDGGTTAGNETKEAANTLKSEMGDEAFNEAASAINEALNNDTTTENFVPFAVDPDEVVTLGADDLDYQKRGDFIAIKGYDGTEKYIRVPDEIEDTPVKRIQDFKNESIVYIELPESINEISDSAFDYCKSLKKIAIPENVTTIGRNTFSYCDDLSEVVLHDGITSIGLSAFEKCYSLAKIELPDSLEELGDACFMMCDSLVTIKIPNGIKSIPDSGFRMCHGLKSIELPDTLESIGVNAFLECEKLERLDIPDSVTKIGALAFEYIPNITITYKGATYTQDNMDELYELCK